MSDQLSASHEAHWVSLITAGPAAELPERAAVAVLFGNGKPVALRLQRDLPRLAGIAGIDTRRSFYGVLQQVQRTIESGRASLEGIRSALGPQFTIQEPKALARDLSDQIIDLISKQMLCAPVVPNDDPAEAVIRRSQRALLDQLQQSSVQMSLVAQRKHARELYPTLARDIPSTMPRVHVAIRGSGRDALVDGVAFGEGFDDEQVRAYIGRISQAFFEYRTHLRPLIRSRERRDLKLVSVVQALEPNASVELRQLRAFALDALKHQSDVIVDASATNPVEELSTLGQWVARD